MKIEYDVEKITEILNDFGLITKASATVYDANYSPIAYSSPPDISYPLCEIIKGSKNYCDECSLCDFAKFKESEFKNEPLLYTCHAGLVETVSALTYDNIIIGYIIFGKFIDAEHEYSKIENIASIAEKYGIPYDVFSAAYKRHPVLSKTELNSSLHIMNICIQFIMQNQLIQLKTNLLPQKIKEYILDNLADSSLSIGKLCKQFFINTNKLYSVFHSEFGMTVHDFIIDARIDKAKNLLTFSDKTLIEISESIGFSDYSYFIRIFKKRTGTSPLKYRLSPRPNK